MVGAPQRPVVPLARLPQPFGIPCVVRVEHQLGRGGRRHLRCGFAGHRGDHPLETLQCCLEVSGIQRGDPVVPVHPPIAFRVLGRDRCRQCTGDITGAQPDDVRAAIDEHIGALRRQVRSELRAVHGEEHRRPRARHTGLLCENFTQHSLALGRHLVCGREPLRWAGIRRAHQQPVKRFIPLEQGHVVGFGQGLGIAVVGHVDGQLASVRPTV